MSNWLDIRTQKATLEKHKYIYGHYDARCPECDKKLGSMLYVRDLIEALPTICPECKAFIGKGV